MAAKKEIQFVIRARDLTRGVFRRIGRTIGNVRTQIAGLVGAIGVSRLVRNMLDFATSIQAASERLDISAESLQRWKALAEDVNVPLETFTAVLQNLQSNIGQALGGDTKMFERFRQFGFTMDDLNRLSPDEIFLRIADAAQAAGQDRGFRDLLRDVGETEALRLLPLLRQGSAELIRRRNEVAVQMNEAIRQTAQEEAEIRREILQLQRELNGELRQLLPVLIEALRLVNEIVRGLRTGDVLTPGVGGTASRLLNDETQRALLRRLDDVGVRNREESANRPVLRDPF